MRKMILILLLLSASNLFADDVFISEQLDSGAIEVRADDLTIGKDDWIAIYPKNASNAWKNVIDWKWVRLTPTEKSGRYHIYSGAIRIKKSGEYQVRYFKNNSYKLYKAFDFNIAKKRDSFVTKLIPDMEIPNHPQIVISGFIKNVTVPAPKEWIGIFKKGDDNNWRNVIEWKWAKDTYYNNIQDKYHRIMPLDSENYSADVRYEARYFLNNSYNMYLKSKPFYIPKLNKLNIEGISASYKNENFKFKVWLTDGTEFKHGSKDWIALYKEGDSNDWKNVLTWGWAKDFKQLDNKHYELIKTIHLEKGKTYDVRYFKNNSYNVYMHSQFKVYK